MRDRDAMSAHVSRGIAQYSANQLPLRLLLLELAFVGVVVGIAFESFAFGVSSFVLLVVGLFLPITRLLIPFLLVMAWTLAILQFSIGSFGYLEGGAVGTCASLFVAAIHLAGLNGARNVAERSKTSKRSVMSSMR